MKTCSRCKVEKPLEDFNRDSSRTDGRQSYCRPCSRAWYAENRDSHAENVRAWAIANPERRAQISRDWVRANPDKVKLNKARRRACEAGALFIPMTPRELRRLYSQPCAHCGATEDMHRDHIIPLSKGGPDTFGNSQMLCGSCNKRKGAKYEFEARVYARKIGVAA